MQLTINNMNRYFLQINLEEISSNLFKIVLSIYKYLKDTLNLMYILNVI
jgi:hypothetical protein